MKHRARRILRGTASCVLMLATLWAVAAAAPADSLEQARSMSTERFLQLALLRFERGDMLCGELTLPTQLALYVTPLLLPADEETAPAADERRETAPAAEDASAVPSEPPEAPARDKPQSAPPLVTGADNGVRATTLRPSDPSGYLIYENVFVNNASSAALDPEDLSFDFAAKLTDDAPQVLIVHTHGCEAYTMPPGEEYEASDDHRTLDEGYNVVRVGDEIARVLEAAGIGVLHDRTLHDYPGYSGAYNRSLETVERYRAEYPSIVYVLDVHRDAVTDESGEHYKLLCAEEPAAAQLEFVVGSDGGGLEHPNWRDNLRLACAVQSTLLADYPTLMRPIIVRNSRYNQQVTTGSLLVEVGTAGNSLAEALAAARLFAQGFAKTLKS